MNNVKQELEHISTELSRHIEICSGGYKVPDTYFESLEQDFTSKIHSNPYETPEGYFDTLEDTLMSGIEKAEGAKVISIRSKVQRAIPWLVAASVILVAGVWSINYNINGVSADESMLTSLSVEDLEEYMEYNIDEISLADLAVEDISFDEELYWISEDIDDLEEELLQTDLTEEELLEFL